VRQSITHRITLLLVLLTVLWSCNKDPELIGLDLVPDSDLLNHAIIDTTTIFAYTLREEKLNTTALSTSLLGSMADPAFGTTTASIYTQFLLTNRPEIGSNTIVDSMVLTIPYKGIYGDEGATQNIQVYQLNDTISKYTTYYQNSSLPIAPEVIGQATFVPNLTHYDSIDGVRIVAHMRIVLSAEFANKFITAPDTAYSSNTAFTDYFKGIYLTADKATTPGTGAIMYMDLTHPQSRISLYYRTNTDSITPDTITHFFPVNSFAGRFNSYEHYDYEGADPLLLEQLNGDTTAGVDRLYVQAMAGTKVLLRFPYLDSLAKLNIAVHEAALIFENALPDEDYPIPALMGIGERIPGIDSLTGEVKYDLKYIPDENDIPGHIDGNAQNNKLYRIRITRYVQQRLLNPEKDDNPLILFAAGGSLTANRVILNGPKAETGKMRLVIYYTPLR
jgi:hypothetical protein